MKSSKIILTFLILFSAAQFCAAQEKPDSVLLDRTDECYAPDHLRGRIINFLEELQKDPGSRGLVVINSEENLSPASFFFFNEVSGQIDYYKFPRDRVTILRVYKPGKPSLEFWKVLTEIPVPIILASWTYGLLADTKPFRLGNTFTEEGFPVSYELCAGFLRANPGFHGNIAVFDTTPRAARKAGQEWIKILTEQYKIPRSQLRVFYNKAKRFEDGSGNYPDVEFWLVPPGKKNSRRS